MSLFCIGVLVGGIIVTFVLALCRAADDEYDCEGEHFKEDKER